MDRKEFLKACGLSCLGVLGLAGALQSCGTTYYASSSIQGNRLVIARKEFEMLQDNAVHYRNYIVSKVDSIDYPIIVYRNSDNSYTALLLRCSHQGAELSVNGDMLTCSAHGSEFGKNGEVTQGPAEQQLTTFRVQTDAQNIYIQLLVLVR